MQKKRVLFVSQEMQPFLPEAEISKTVRGITQGIQEAGKEIRSFMPRYGVINERRHQLHEVIRLSGMNLIIDDADHPLIIKVATVPGAKMQMYFIDNEEYFKRKAVYGNDDEAFFADNDERAMFFCRGVVETVKKLGWKPDVIHCNGWMTGLLPLYLKKFYHEDPHFSDAKVVYSVYESAFEGELNGRLADKLKFDGFVDADVEAIAKPSAVNLNKLGCQFADAIVEAGENISKEDSATIKDSGKPFLAYQNEESRVEALNEFYDKILESDEVLAN